MARPLRIEYPGAFYHVTSRGNEQKDIFKSKSDREKFISYLESASVRYGAVIHAYCMMGNHFHLLIETPRGNLSQIMKHINSSYTMYFNVKRKRAGHLLQGRYKAILIDGDAYAIELSRYIHLNPVRAGIVGVPEDYLWMSYRYYTGENVPDWLTTDFILSYLGDNPVTAKKRYKHFVHDLIKKEYQSPLLETVASTILGSPEFISAIQDQHLDRKKAHRDLPALRELTGKISLIEIVKAAKKYFPDKERLAKKLGIYICHRYSGAKLKEIGGLFQLTESGVTRSSKRFEESMRVDKMLKEIVKNLLVDMNASNA